MKTEPSEAEIARQEAARALNAAAEQISLAMRESQPQVEALGDALHELAAALAGGQRTAVADPATLAAVMRRAVTRLQFYDRMTQHLSHVQDYLTRSADNIASHEPHGGWTGVHRQLSDRLLSDTQRFHLGKNFQEGLLKAASAETRERSGRAAPGDIDLF
jgi:hypothetical protein